MANEKDLVALMQSRRKLWTAGELCSALDVHVCTLVRLVARARKLGTPVQYESGEHTGYTSKYLLVEG
ncbi:HTH domain-containing protein [Vibrio parahaemolyticus]|uniref:HTH domain-containing protein n=1 Tax=Vibrio parahaemolyticus TaxID=670 RepID=UPI000992503B|nr:HTH domain-containing protein [Vibrio parahaemolyticus]OOQ68169.1 hypothetical protein BSR61_20730 [Vibrio parahaemolyticus]PMT76235.1 HTH domain-containing protein [Vibrio parahaemolyticus]PMT81771.1 HTH domain-containing protein [Vibrio parahaemolyticus]